MKRSYCLELLRNYQAHELDEHAFTTRTIQFINDNPDCFERTLTHGHITASAWLLNKAGTHALFMHHRKLDRWYQLGGHCDGDPDVLAVAIKEAQEESGIMGIAPISTAIFDIDIHPIPATSTEAAHEHFDLRFLLQVTSDEQFRLNSESKELRWVGKDPAELPNKQRSITRMFDKWLLLP